MLSYQEAVEVVIANAGSFGQEVVALDDALGRVLCEVIHADRDYPPFNRSAMDGYAIKFSDWEKGIREFSIAETIYAGKSSSRSIADGECYKIMTGAAVPTIADVVVRREDTSEAPATVKILLDSVQAFQCIAQKGEDLMKGEVIIAGATKCTHATIGLLASIGKSRLSVEALPKVAVITTGDEVLSVDSIVNEVQIRNSNAAVLRSLLNRWGIQPFAIEHVPDDLIKVEAALSQHLKVDIIILNGGVSAGDADFVPAVLEKLGAKKIFHKVAIRPGKPLWFGRFPNGPVVFALPGNPFSCIVTFKLFIEAFLSASFGLGHPAKIALPLNGTRSKKTMLDEFFPVKITGNPAVVEPLPFNGSGDITAAIDADAIAQHPFATNELAAGTILECRLL